MEVPLSEKSEKVLNLSSRCLFAEHEMPYVHRSFVFTATGITLVATTSLIGYVLYRRRRSLSSARARVDRDLSTIFADRDQSEMEKSKPVQCDIPVISGLKTFVACAKGKDENTILGGWVPKMRRAGSVVVMTQLSDMTSLTKDPDGVFDLVVVEDGEDVDADNLNEILEQLKPGCKVQVVFHRGAPSPANKRALMFAGFVEVAVSSSNERVLVGERPKWICGASAPFRLPMSSPTTAAALTLPAMGVSSVTNGNSRAPPAEKKTWKLMMDDDDGDGFGADAGGDDDLVDEDSLLESSAPVKRNSEQGSESCATKRRACKDCSCGRAQEEGDGMPQTVVSVTDVDDVLVSSCGNCSKGDAFRCGGCPFLGKPAFEKGQEKAIMLADLNSQQDD